MPTSTLLNNVSANTTGTGQSITGPCTVHFKGNMGGGFVRLETAAANTPADFRTFEVRRDQEPVVVSGTGTYFLRAVLLDSSGASLTVEAVN